MEDPSVPSGVEGLKSGSPAADVGSAPCGVVSPPAAPEFFLLSATASESFAPMASPPEMAAVAAAAAAPTVACPAAAPRMRPSVPGMKSATCLMRMNGKIDERIMPTVAISVGMRDPSSALLAVDIISQVTQMHNAMTGCMRIRPTIQPAHLDRSGRMVLHPWSMIGMAAMTTAKTRRKLRAAIMRMSTKLPATTQMQITMTNGAMVMDLSASAEIDGTSLLWLVHVCRMLLVNVLTNAEPLTHRVMHTTVMGHARAVRAIAPNTAPMSWQAAARTMPYAPAATATTAMTPATLFRPLFAADHIAESMSLFLRTYPATHFHEFTAPSIIHSRSEPMGSRMFHACRERTAGGTHSATASLRSLLSRRVRAGHERPEVLNGAIGRSSFLIPAGCRWPS